ncbi:MAG: restriction endonuclease [Bacteroidales bacterium]|jgi:hypothetical protein|nr:restriction endonuclease [Bacteroidales bacterium]
MEHSFTQNIKEILKKNFSGDNISEIIFEKSQLIQYINKKTKSANKNSKQRSSYANLFAIYVLIDDYIKYTNKRENIYSNYEGAKFSDLLENTRKLPFGKKLQNHALNHRMNEEFKKYFQDSEYTPILRDLTTKRYWINENLLKLNINNKNINIAESIKTIIERYIEIKQQTLKQFIDKCNQLKTINKNDTDKVTEFINSLLNPNVDARLFEIVSFSILKYYYDDQTVFWGYNKKELKEENLKLYKTGHTNANDGGIDFIMKPLGKIFQVTETLDFNKYFLDIDKVEKYPITFVVKSTDDNKTLLKKIKNNALKSYSITKIVDNYMNCIEDIINIQELEKRFTSTINKKHLNDVLEEIIKQSKLEFDF